MLTKQFTIIILILSLFLLFKSELKADTSRDIYTPIGTLVGDSYDTDELHWTTRRDLDIYYASAYPNATQLTLWGDQYSSSGKYNCHGYAWHMIGDNAINDPVWIGYYNPGMTYKYWQDASFIEVAVQNATMVDYSGDHSAVTTGETDIYISKWRYYPLMKHHKDYHPGYGNPVGFYVINPVDPPTNLYISGYQGGMPRINWTASTSPNIDYYELWWKQIVGPPYGWQLLTTTPATSWVDSRVTIDLYGPEDTYGYKARAVNTDGLKSGFSNSDYVNVDESPPWWKVLAGEREAIPEAYALRENYPNPFNPTTTIRYALPEDSFTELRIYDLMGREIRTLVNGNETAGYKNVLWDGKDSFGNPVSSGVYIYRISTKSTEGGGQFSQVRKMILLR